MYLSSFVVVRARQIYVNIHGKRILSINEMCEARDYVITLISLKNGTSPGALENMKMAEYLQANADPVTGHKDLLAPQHKRQTDGRAPFSLDDELQELFDIYLKEIYPQFPAPRGDTVTPYIVITDTKWNDIRNAKCSNFGAKCNPQN